MGIYQGKTPHEAALRSLWHTCFGDDADYIDWCFTERFGEQNLLSLWEGDTLHGMTAMPEYEVSIEGHKLCCGFIEGLCTAPEYRMQHVAKRLMQQALSVMREQKKLFCFLVPFSEEYYQHQGFCPYNTLYTWHVPHNLTKESPYTLCRWQGGGEEWLSLYGDYMIGYDSCFCRTPQDAAAILSGAKVGGAEIYSIMENDRVVGYCYVEEKKHSVVVKECVAPSANPDKIAAALLTVYPDKEISIVLGEGEARSIEGLAATGYAMGRIIDVVSVLMLYAPYFSGETILRVTDDLCPWNNVTLLVNRIDVEVTNRSAEIVLSIGELLSLLWGKTAAEFLTLPRQNRYANLLFD